MTSARTETTPPPAATTPRWARRLPLGLALCVTAMFSSWGREYVVTVALLAGMAVGAAHAMLAGPAALAWAVGRLRRRRQKTTNASADSGAPPFIAQLIRSGLWCGLGIGILVVLLMGPTGRIVGVGMIAVWGLRALGAPVPLAALGAPVASIAAASLFRETTNPTSAIDGVYATIVILSVCLIWVERLQPLFRLVLRAAFVVAAAIATFILLLSGPAWRALIAIAVLCAAAVWRGANRRWTLAIGGVVATVVVASFASGGPTDPMFFEYFANWAAIGVVTGLALLVLRWTTAKVDPVKARMRRFLAIALALGFYAMQWDWQMTPAIYERMPTVPCETLARFPEIEDGAGVTGAVEHKIYDIRLSEDGGTLVFCDKLARRLGAIDLATGSQRFSPRLQYMPERIRLEPDGRHAVVFMKDDILYRPGQMARFDLTDFSIVKTCPKGSWVDFAPAGEPGRFVTIQELIEDICEVDMETCEIRSADIATRLPYGLAATEDGDYFVSGWFFSATLSAARRMPGGGFTETRSKWIGPFALGMAVDDASHSLFVTRPTLWAVDVLDTRTLDRKFRMSAPPWTRVLVTVPEHDAVVTANFYTGQVAALRASDGGLIATWKGPIKEARSMLWDAPRERLFVTGRTEIVQCEVAGLWSEPAPRPE